MLVPRDGVGGRLDDLDDHARQLAVRVGAAQGGGGLGHVRHPVDVEQHGQQGVPDPFRRQVGVLDEQAAAAGHDRLRVEPLLSVSVRERDKGPGQPNRGELGARQRAAPAERKVGGGVGQIHPVHERHRDVRRPAGARRDLRRVARAGHVQHLHPGRTEPPDRPVQRAVQRLGALRAAGHEQNGQVGPEPEVGAGLVAEREPVQLGDLTADRDPQVGGVRQLGVGIPGEHVLGQPGAQFVGQAGARVRLVDHDRDVPAARGEITGRGHVPAEADEDIRLHPVEHPGGGVDCAGQPPGHRDEGRADRTWHRYGGDQGEFVPPHRDKPGLQAPFGTQADDQSARVGLAQRISERKRRFNMSGGPAAG